jgi:hypothetical protein
MKKLTCTMLLVLGMVAIAFPLTSSTAAAEDSSVTGAAQGVFPAGTAFEAVTLESLNLGTGVFIESDGSATGVFHSVLAGHSVLGPRQITVEGNVSQGAVTSDGRGSFSGIATVDLGDGTSLPGIPFTVTLGTDSVALTVGPSVLPAASLTSGAVTIEP